MASSSACQWRWSFSWSRNVGVKSRLERGWKTKCSFSAVSWLTMRMRHPRGNVKLAFGHDRQEGSQGYRHNFWSHQQRSVIWNFWPVWMVKLWVFSLPHTCQDSKCPRVCWACLDLVAVQHGWYCPLALSTSGTLLGKEKFSESTSFSRRCHAEF